MNSIFLTDSTIRKDTGGGIVSYKIAEALSESTSLLYTIDENEMRVPNIYRQDAFSKDYFTLKKMQEKKMVDRPNLLVTYGAPFGESMRYAINELGCDNVIADVAPHNIEVSRTEHRSLGYPFELPHLTEEKYWFYYTEHIREADQVIVHAKMGGEYLKEKCGIHGYKVIPHGCFLPSEIPTFPDKFVVGHLGVNGADKGQRYLIDAMRKTGMPLLIAGNGTQYWGGHGYIEDTSLVYKNCSVYVQPSVTEGFGIPVLEAMAYGRPVIATEGTGASELITDGINGFVVPIKDPLAIADKLEELQSWYSSGEFETMSKRARETAEKYTWDKVKAMYIETWTK